VRQGNVGGTAECSRERAPIEIPEDIVDRVSRLCFGAGRGPGASRRFIWRSVHSVIEPGRSWITLVPDMLIVALIRTKQPPRSHWCASNLVRRNEHLVSAGRGPGQIKGHGATVTQASQIGRLVTADR
jgi:hypothetical protein